MEEKKLIQSESGNIKIVRAIIWVLGGLAGSFYWIAITVDNIYRGIRYGFYGVSIMDGLVRDWSNNFSIAFPVTVSIFVVFLIIGQIVYIGLSKTELCVTDKRVYGKTIFGRQVDLPLDSISALGKRMFQTIAVSTSSGLIKFWGIGNRDEIYEVISKLLKDRQGEKSGAGPVTDSQIQQGVADELKKFKDLLDSGVITQEEFEAKKKQLLGL